MVVCDFWDQIMKAQRLLSCPPMQSLALQKSNCLVVSLLQRGPCGKELRPPANAHVNEAGSGFSTSPSQAFRWLRPSHLLNCTLTRDLESEPPSEATLGFLFFFFWLQQAACRILVLWPGIEHSPSAVKAQSLNHWTAKEVPALEFLTHRNWDNKAAECWGNLLQSK